MNKMNVDELIEFILINKNGMDRETVGFELSNDLLETLKVIENCTNCKDKTRDEYEFHKSINEIENCLTSLQREEQDMIIIRLNDELFNADHELNERILCEDCKEKKIDKLTDKCGNEELARFFYQCKLNAKYYFYIQWISFNEFKNIEYLAKGGFAEVYKATWINGGYYNYDERKYKDEVVLKRIYNNSSDDKIVDILNEVK